jgi:chromosome segregation ATPase
MTNTGDMVVCGVTSDFIIEDIAFSVPKGHAVTVPADLVVRSIDLHRALSQGIIFQLNINSLLFNKKSPRAPAVEEERFANDLAHALQSRTNGLTDENQVLKGDQAKLQEENVRLQTELAAVKAEKVRLEQEAQAANSTDEKLNQMLTLLKDRPTVMQTVVQGSRASLPEFQEEAAPNFIPSQIKPDGVDASRIAVQETTAEAGGVSQAKNALRRLKSQQGGQ